MRRLGSLLALCAIALACAITPARAGATTKKVTTKKAATPKAPKPPAAGRRFTVGIFGDSVTEGAVIPNYEYDGLAPQLAQAERSYGYTPGGTGLIPVNQYLWKFNSWGLYQLQTVPLDGWSLIGSQTSSLSSPGVAGPSGYSAVATLPTATATTVVKDPVVQILYQTTPMPCTFRVTSGLNGWQINTQVPGEAPKPAQSEIDLGPGAHTLVVSGPTCGLLNFEGAVGQDPIAAKTDQIQVDDDGHAAATPGTDENAGVESWITAQHYNLTIFLYSYLATEAVTPGPLASTYESTLLERARLARRNNGKCLMAAPAPLPTPASSVRLVSQIDQKVAKQAGCSYTTALTTVWNSPLQAVQKGYTVVDGFHPTAKGYKIMAKALAPVVTKLLQ